MTWLTFINYILQFFCIRIARCSEVRISSCRLVSVSETKGGLSFETIPNEFHTPRWYSVMYWVVPFSGWSTPFKYWSKVKYWRFTKVKTVPKDPYPKHVLKFPQP